MKQEYFVPQATKCFFKKIIDGFQYVTLGPAYGGISRNMLHHLSGSFL